jgi:heme oxygenase
MRLKDLTAAAHARLDTHVDQAGFFASQRGYRQYLLATWHARADLEAQLDRSNAASVFPLWPQRRLRDLLLRDLADIGPPDHERAATPEDPPLHVAAMLGTLYVLEGSALGARLIERRVAHLGMTAEFGARHLARQTTRNAAWASFLEVLEQTVLPSEREDDCVSSALATFDRFERAYRAAE